MDKKLRSVLSKLFDEYCFILTKRGSIVPTYFLIKDYDLIQIKNIGLNENIYASLVFAQAEIQGAEAVVLLSENQVVTGDKTDSDMQALLDKKISISDHPEKEPYLILVYLEKNGEREALFGKIEKDPSGNKFIKEHEWATDIVAQ